MLRVSFTCASRRSSSSATPMRCAISTSLAPGGCFPAAICASSALKDCALALPLQDVRHRRAPLTTSALTLPRRCSIALQRGAFRFRVRRCASSSAPSSAASARRADGVQILPCATSRFRPAQHVDRVDFLRRSAFSPSWRLHQPFGQFFVQISELCALDPVPETQVAFDFAAGQAATDTFTDHRLQAAGIVPGRRM